MNKWWWFLGGVVAGYVVAPKLAALIPFRVPQVGG